MERWEMMIEKNKTDVGEEDCREGMKDVREIKRKTKNIE